MSGSTDMVLRSAAAIIALGAAACLAAGDAPRTTAPAEPAPPPARPWFPPPSPEGYFDREGIWHDRWPIPVCWEASARRFAAEKRWVEQAVGQVIEAASPVEFAGSRNAPRRWPDCTPVSMGIRIAAANIRPVSEVGQQWRRNASGGREAELPTHMTLNFVLDGLYRTTCNRRREFCIRVIAVHEFLHAIGFLHEHLRSDAPADCRRQFEHQSDFAGYRPVRTSDAYDPESMTNYCVSIFRVPIRLSAYDIAGIRYFYATQ